MNRREIALIESHGGILKDMDRELQTLNLTSEGKATRENSLKAFLQGPERTKSAGRLSNSFLNEKSICALQDYVEVVNGKEVKLGQTVKRIRSEFFLALFRFQSMVGFT